MAHTDLNEIPGAALFEARREIFPKAVDGTYRRLKWAIMAVALTIYYVTPWLRWNRGPFAPSQAVLIDMARRRFYMFSIEIWPNEFYYVAGMLIMAGIGLFLVTSAVGRAWCGYACPQTVWTDLFMHVERLIDGDRNAQYRLAAAPMTPAKIARRALKYAIWLLIAVATGGAWIFYFADAPTLFHSLFNGTAPSVAYATIAVLTSTTFVLGGFMREQVCIYMCPWPRIQGAMLDEQSMVVTYKHWRGEPRTRGLKRANIAATTEKAAYAKADQPVDGSVVLAELNTAPSLAALLEAAPASKGPGDCIDCGACISVCPTGIDIREGSQIGCITCGLCIDACDQMMTKIGRPTRLIGYTTVADAKLAVQGKPIMPPLKRLFRLRTMLYFLVWGGIGLGMLFALGTRSRLELSVLRDRNPIYVRMSDGSIRNSYTIKVRNMESRPRSFQLIVSGLPGGIMFDENHPRQGATDRLQIDADSDRVEKRRVFLIGSAAGPEHVPIAFQVKALDREGGEQTDQSVFERPGN